MSVKINRKHCVHSFYSLLDLNSFFLQIIIIFLFFIIKFING